VELNSNLERYIWDNWVTPEFLKGAGFIDMYVLTFDAKVFRHKEDAYFFTEKKESGKYFYKLEYLKRYCYPEVIDDGQHNGSSR
jgi:hypothetical protein